MRPPLLLDNLTTVGVVLSTFAAVALVLHLQERAVSRYVAHRLGWRGVLLTGWLGVPVHELGHLLLALLFRHRIIAWKLFDPDPVTGTLGYVRHACSRPTLLQGAGNFFIAVAPLLSGAAVLALLLWWMLPATELRHILAQAAALDAHVASAGDAARAMSALGGALFDALWHQRSPLLALQLYLCVAVACHMAPSRADLAAALPGLALTLVLLAAGATLAAVVDTRIAGVLIVLPLAAGLLVGATMFQLAYVGIIKLASSHRRGRRGLELGPRQARS